MRRILVPVVAGVVAAGLAVGPTQAAQKKSLVFVTNVAADFWTFARRGIEKAQKEHPDYDMEMIVTTEGTAAAQRRELDDLVARGVSGITVSVDDAAHATQELDRVAAKTLLFTTDSDAPQSKRVVYIGTDNVAAGRQAGNEIKQALPNGGDIMLFVGTLDADNARERLKGIKEVLAGTKINILDVRTDQADFAKAKANAEDTLAKYPHISLLAGLWSYNTPEIYDAVKGAGKCGTVKIVGFDEDARTLRGISDGCVISTIVQQPFQFGYQSMTDMVKYLSGDKSFVPADGQIIVPTRVIDKSNVADFTAQVKKLLGK